MIQLRRHTTIPAGIMDMRVRAPASAAAVPWYLAGGAPTPIAVYEPKGKASLATSYVNLVNPGTYDAAPGTAPTLDTDGWVFVAASSQYLLTGIIPGSGWSLIIQYSNQAANLVDSYLCGSYVTSANAFLVTGCLGTQSIVRYMNANAIDVAPRHTSGNLAIAGTSGYRNGISETTALNSNVSSQPQIAIGCIMLPTPYGFTTAKIQAVAIWNTSTNHATWMPAVMAAVALI